jgi:hypothetical protein
MIVPLDTILPTTSVRRDSGSLCTEARTVLTCSNTVDLTTKAAGDHRSDRTLSSGDIETGSSSSGVDDHGSSEGHNHGGPSSAVTKIKTKVAGIVNTLTSNGDSEPALAPAMPDKLAHLVDGFRASDQAKITEAEVHRLHQGVGLDGLREVTSETTPFRTYKRASWWTQFKVLSSRAFKNLYRYGKFAIL